MTHALIVNAYSVGNRGDAAIVQGLIDTLRAAGATSVAVAARGWQADGDAWRELGADDVVPPLFATYDLPAWVRRLRPLRLAYLGGRWLRFVLAARGLVPGNPASDSYRRARVVVTVGGAYLGGPRLILNLAKAMNIAYARAARRALVIGPMTINPPSGAVARVLRWAFTDASVYVRDDASRALLRSMRVDSVVVPDLAFRAGALRAARQATSTIDGASQGAQAPERYLCCAPRSFRPTHDAWERRDEIDELLAEAMAGAMRATGLRLRFVSQVQATEADDDARAVARLRDRLPDDLREMVETAGPAGSLDEAVSQYAACDVLLASRLHASLMAMATGVPALVVGYEPKVRGVMSGLGLEGRVIDPVQPGSGEQLVERLLALRTPAERDRTLAAVAAADGKFAPLDTELRRLLSASAGG